MMTPEQYFWSIIDRAEMAPEAPPAAEAVAKAPAAKVRPQAPGGQPQQTPRMAPKAQPAAKPAAKAPAAEVRAQASEPAESRTAEPKVESTKICFFKRHERMLF